MSDALKLSVYFGERDLLEGEFLADRLLSILGSAGVGTAVLMRGVEGFGLKHGRRTDRLLSLSEDLPVVAVGIDRPARIEAAVAEIEPLALGGLITIERARLPDAPAGEESVREPADRAETKLTLYLGRGRRAGNRPAHEAAVDILRESGVEGATVLLGVDGFLDGSRRRARFFARNEDVPAMVVSVGSAGAVARALPELASLPGPPLPSLERARVCKRDGVLLRGLEDVPESDGAGMHLWQKLILYSSEQAHVDGRPAHVEAIRRLRSAGASGATALRGIWGYEGSHRPHGDSLRSLRRRVPTLTVVVDTPSNSRQWFEILDEVSPERGLITSEVVPAMRALGGGAQRGGLRLATTGPGTAEPQ